MTSPTRLTEQQTADLRAACNHVYSQQPGLGYFYIEQILAHQPDRVAAILETQLKGGLMDLAGNVTWPN